MTFAACMGEDARPVVDRGSDASSDGAQGIDGNPNGADAGADAVATDATDDSSDGGADTCTFCTGFDQIPFSQGWDDVLGGSSFIDLGPSDAGPRSAPGALRIRVAGVDVAAGQSHFLAKAFSPPNSLKFSFHLRIVSPNTQPSVLEVASVQCQSVTLYLDAVNLGLVAGHIPADGGGLNHAPTQTVDGAWHAFSFTMGPAAAPQRTRLTYELDGTPYHTQLPTIPDPLGSCTVKLGAPYTTGGVHDQTIIDFDDVRVDLL